MTQGVLYERLGQLGFVNFRKIHEINNCVEGPFTKCVTLKGVGGVSKSVTKLLMGVGGLLGHHIIKY